MEKEFYLNGEVSDRKTIESIVGKLNLKVAITSAIKSNQKTSWSFPASHMEIIPMYDGDLIIEVYSRYSHLFKK